jgi:hypothetical protein
MLNSLSIKSENAFLYPCSIFDSISVSYCTSYPPAYLFAMGDRLPLYVIAERRGMNNMEGERTHKKPRQSNRSPYWQRRLSKHEEKRWHASRGSDKRKKTVGKPERRIWSQPRQSNKAARWLLWESWASNPGIAHRFFTAFLSRHPFSYSSDSEKHEHTISVLCLLPPTWLLAKVPI